MDIALPRSALRLSRWAVIGMFFANGALGATWATRIPAIQTRLHLGTGQLGVALLGAAIGALIAMNLSGMLATRFGSRPVTVSMGAAMCLTLVLLALAPTWPALIGALFLYGATNGAMDVAMNTQAVGVERRWGRPILSSFHAWYSLGGLVGAGISSAIVAQHIAPLPHFLGAAGIMGCLVGSAALFLLPPQVDAQVDAPAFVWPPAAILLMGIIAFCIVLGEGAMADWSAIYLTTIRATPALAAAGFAAFSLTMAAMRFGGDWVTARIGPLAVIRAGGGLAAAGLAMALLVPQPTIAIAGFAAVGLGFATVFPTAISLAGKTPGMATGTAIAAVATCGYFGLLVGPVLIGGVASLVTLRLALGLVALLSCIAALLATVMRPR